MSNTPLIYGQPRTKDEIRLQKILDQIAREEKEKEVKRLKKQTKLKELLNLIYWK